MYCAMHYSVFFMLSKSMIEFDNELMLCVCSNALRCSHLYHDAHKCTELCKRPGVAGAVLQTPL